MIYGGLKDEVLYLIAGMEFFSNMTSNMATKNDNRHDIELSVLGRAKSITGFVF